MSAQKIKIEKKKIKIMKNWRQLKLMQDIQIFFGFANFYKYFIQDLQNIVRLLTSMFLATLLISISSEIS